jgi:hypothetical protein
MNSQNKKREPLWSPRANGTEYTFGTDWHELLQHASIELRAKG